ncbi:hypothetical protein Goshw_015435 [Gossypium schwendimanii]|uniref:Uncharacterized protein n=1 Tax=Gossypium schwendimanii TaxID=34291 RepID=A0A7J9N3U0_GOSSC|nr:hypothetical protein [Gossypium schwendimanii]
MASPSDHSNSEVVYRRQNKGPPFKFLVPLVYAPVLPLIRLSLRKNPVLRDRLFTIVLAGAFIHGVAFERLIHWIVKNGDAYKQDWAFYLDCLCL